MYGYSIARSWLCATSLQSDHAFRSQGNTRSGTAPPAEHVAGAREQGSRAAWYIKVVVLYLVHTPWLSIGTSDEYQVANVMKLVHYQSSPAEYISIPLIANMSSQAAYCFWEISISSFALIGGTIDAFLCSSTDAFGSTMTPFSFPARLR
jgi:hypothetical protein